MNQTFENPQTFVRSIKGAPCSVLMALFFVQRPMNGKELARWTGYADENITNAVHLLTDLGWLVAISPRGPWGLAGKARQLPLVNFFEDREPDIIGIENATTTTIGREQEIILNQVVAVEKQTRKNRTRDTFKPTNPHFEANMKACRSSHIGSPVNRELSDMFDEYEQPITPDFILAHVEDAGPDNIGLAITRIRGGEIPSAWLEDLPTRRDIENEKEDTK